MNIKTGRLIQVVILIGMICTLLFLREEKAVDTMEEETVQLETKEQVEQEKSDNSKIMEEKEDDPVQEKTLDLPEMEWALFLSTEFSWGASGQIAKRYAIYGDFTKTKKEAEDTYFTLCKKILGTVPELAAYTDWEEKNQEYEYQVGWVEIMDEHIVDCSVDMNEIISWERSEFLSDRGIRRWYENGEQIKEIDSNMYERNLILQQKEENNTPMETIIVIEGVLEEVFAPFHTYYSRTLWEVDSAGKVMAVANGTSGDADAIYVYSLDSPKAVLLYELAVSVDEARWPIQISQIKGDIHGGWIVYTYGYETYRMKYPKGETEKLGEYMFSASYSPDEQYLVYCTGNEDMWDSWTIWAGVDESMIEKYIVPMKEEWEKIPQGWYVINLTDNEKTYIPIPYWKYDVDRPLVGGRCTWIEKDKLMELLEME